MKGAAAVAITVLCLIGGGFLLNALAKSSAQPEWLALVVGATRGFKMHHSGWPKTAADLQPYDSEHACAKCHPVFQPISDGQAYLYTDGWTFGFPTRERHLLTFRADNQLTDK